MREAKVGVLMSKSYHGQLLKLAVVVIILGVVFLMFWQSVLSAQPVADFTQDYCSVLLDGYALDANSIAVFDIGQDGILESCSADRDALTSLSVGWSGSYDCSGATVRYKLDEKQSSFIAIIESEIPEFQYLNDTLIINLTGVPRFTYSIRIYNPALRGGFDELSGKLKANSCEIA